MESNQSKFDLSKQIERNLFTISLKSIDSWLSLNGEEQAIVFEIFCSYVRVENELDAFLKQFRSPMFEPWITTCRSDENKDKITTAIAVFNYAAKSRENCLVSEDGEIQFFEHDLLFLIKSKWDVEKALWLRKEYCRLIDNCTKYATQVRESGIFEDYITSHLFSGRISFAGFRKGPLEYAGLEYADSFTDRKYEFFLEKELQRLGEVERKKWADFWGVDLNK